MASMFFGFKFRNITTDEVEVDRKVCSHACWASLKYPSNQQYISEVTWCPNKGHSEHVKLLLPLLFPDIKYQESAHVPLTNGGTRWGVTFTGLKDVMRNHFMFRMFVIRNIDRDNSCTLAFTNLLAMGVEPLQAAVTAANINSTRGFGNRAAMLERKGYACCFGPHVTIADIRAFARDPAKVRNTKSDWAFGEGRGYGYNKDGRNNTTAACNALTKYIPTAKKFASPQWMTFSNDTACDSCSS